MRIGFLIFAVVAVIVGFIIKVITKGRMRRSLGREVGDHELTSLNSWMEVHKNEDQLKKNNQTNQPS
jgi:hypothetical protein